MRSRSRRSGAIRRVRGAILVGLAVAAGVGFMMWLGRREPSVVAVRVPVLSAEGRAGRAAFDRSCASCHGADARGSAQGPPLVHRIYQPGHHADVAFELAVRRGVRAHHWRFGDMPSQPAVTADEVSRVARYVRELQQANGID